ncbi:hypothetical protein ACFL23_00940 [Patescibacteria group bacterium]
MDQEEKNKSEIDLSHKFPSDLSERILSEKQSPKYFFRPGTPKIVRWTVKYSGGLIKNENQANYVLLVFVVVSIIFSLFLVFGRNKKNNILGEIPVNQFVPN